MTMSTIGGSYDSWLMAREARKHRAASLRTSPLSTGMYDLGTCGTKDQSGKKVSAVAD